MADDAQRALSILLVDDHADTLNVLARLLRKCGHTVETAGTVDEAVAAVARSRFDILVSDIALPDGSGTEVMKVVREVHGAPGIALTGHGDEEYIEACEKAGFAERLLKPVIFDKLVKAMEKVLPEVPGPIC
jgi:DNA-binding NtrC family response regulator